MNRYVLKHRMPGLPGAIWANDRTSADLEVMLDEARHSVRIGLEARVWDRERLRSVFHEKPQTSDWLAKHAEPAAP